MTKKHFPKIPGISTMQTQTDTTAPTQHAAPSLYLAGKIGKNDWRHNLVPNLRDRKWKDGPIETDSFLYVGPFFVSCDHGCGHSPGGHGLVQECIEPYYTHDDVIRLNMVAIEEADIVFAYITAPDCHGTIFEIGVAAAKGKRVVMAFAPDIDANDFWFISMQCAAVHHYIRPCCLAEILKDEIQKTISAGCK